MSEQTGATAQQMSEAATKVLAYAVRIGIDAEYRPEMIAQDGMRALAHHGYRIVPADAVCITPEIAATAAEACEAIAKQSEQESREPWVQKNQVRLQDHLDEIESYRAAAAALRGEG